jgi:GTP:adenosylcobinamide-phosphate guanylyltransferase
VDVAGKPMVQWVLDALSGSKYVDNVILVGLSPKSTVRCTKPLQYVSNQGKMVENLQAGGRQAKANNKKAEYVLIVSSDIPGITPEMVDWVVESTSQTRLDVYYNMIPREVMEKRYPGSKRTYTKLKDLQVCGGDMNVARLRTVLGEETDLWHKITAARKSPVKQAALIGFGTALQLLAGKLSLEQAEHAIMKRLGITGKAILCPYAEIGMDVDKPHQLEIIRADLKKRLRKAAAASKPAVKKSAPGAPASKARKTAPAASKKKA